MRKLISFDWAIKRILRNKANFTILEGFLSELLYDNITIVELLESESNQDKKDDKCNRLDIKVKNHKNELMLIELQYRTEIDFMQRMLYAASKAIVEHLAQGERYSNVKKIISINILYFDFGDGDDYIYKGSTNFIGLHNHAPLKLNPVEQDLYKTDRIENIHPEYYLIKVKSFPEVVTDALDEWMLFLKKEEIPETPHAKGLKEAAEELEYLKMNAEERKQYESFIETRRYEATMYESTYIRGKNVGIKEGKEEGIKAGKRQMARSMKAAGYSSKVISDLSGLGTDEIETL
ncbi:MAG: hypothetical protein B0D92_05145 [Spirochaeta sp. LUC14_002_19_P3]|nr:MAG: hypothetical protein B0D92_05145 [Spirochaeta sp. LUC14_002_19_P3]